MLLMLDLRLMGHISITEQLKAQRNSLGQNQHVSIITNMNSAVNLEHIVTGLLDHVLSFQLAQSPEGKWAGTFRC